MRKRKSLMRLLALNLALVVIFVYFPALASEYEKGDYELDYCDSAYEEAYTPIIYSASPPELTLHSTTDTSITLGVAHDRGGLNFSLYNEAGTTIVRNWQTDTIFSGLPNGVIFTAQMRNAPGQQDPIGIDSIRVTTSPVRPTFSVENTIVVVNPIAPPPGMTTQYRIVGQDVDTNWHGGNIFRVIIPINRTYATFSVQARFVGGGIVAPSPSVLSTPYTIFADAVIDSVTTNVTSIQQQGGSAMIMVDGRHYDVSNMRVAAFLNNTGPPLYMAQPLSATGNPLRAVTTLFFPANNTTANRLYTIRVSLDGGHTFLSVPTATVFTEPVLLGDVNNDGVVSAVDLMLLRMYLAGHDISINRAAADLNGDDVITDLDLLLLRLYLAGHDVN